MTQIQQGTPKEVAEAIQAIAGYLRETGYPQVIVNANGSAIFQQTNIHDELFGMYEILDQMEHKRKSPTLPQFL